MIVPFASSKAPNELTVLESNKFPWSVKSILPPLASNKPLASKDPVLNFSAPFISEVAVTSIWFVATLKIAPDWIVKLFSTSIFPWAVLSS